MSDRFVGHYDDTAMWGFSIWLGLTDTGARVSRELEGKPTDWTCNLAARNRQNQSRLVPRIGADPANHRTADRTRGTRTTVEAATPPANHPRATPAAARPDHGSSPTAPTPSRRPPIPQTPQPSPKRRRDQTPKTRYASAPPDP